MKKRFPAVILALALCMGLAIPAFAADDPKPVTIGNITLSDVIITDEYETAWGAFGEDESVPENEFLYNLGTIGFLMEETQEYGYRTFWCYLVPEDADISIHSDEENPSFTIFLYTLEEVEGSTLYRSWQTTFITGFRAELEDGYSESEFLLTKENTEGQLESLGLAPKFDLLRIATDDHDILVWFGGPDAESDTTTEPEPTPSFTDVDAKDWYAEHVAWAVETGITTGKTSTKFAPKDYCTHDQILTFLYRAQRDDGTAPSGSDMALAIEWAKEEGMIDDSFDPKADCTRADAVNYIWQAFGSKEAETEASFPDVADDADYAAAVSWAVEKGIVDGYPDGSFLPGKVCDRGTIVTLLHRAEIRLNADN